MSLPMMEKTPLHRCPKFHANEASNDDDNSCSNNDNHFSNISVSVSLLTSMKSILEDAYDEMIGGASIFHEGTNHIQSEDQHNIRSKVSHPTVDTTPSQSHCHPQ